MEISLTIDDGCWLFLCSFLFSSISKELVSAIPDEEPLTLIVARGTEVLANHETALVNLCSDNPGAQDDKAVEECVVAYLKDAYALDDGNDDNYNGMDINGMDINDDKDTTRTANSNDCSDSEMECMIDSMNAMWANDLPLSNTSTEGITNAAELPKAAKVKPWSSRSSPSGTYVRDPKTGQMRNIDPQ
jgi:hypothetical protein